jgi:N-acyl-D-amino-acid deacylase
MNKYPLLFFCLLLATTAYAQKADILIRNGKIIDGTGNSWYYGDVAIKKDRILAMGNLAHIKARQVIDAKGQVIAPGFIDVHTHIEGEESSSPTADNFIYDGVTTIITGNCGLGHHDIGQYFDFLDSLQLSVNVGSFIGHNAVRKAVMGTANRRPTPQEQQKMEALVQTAMQQGAMGLSTGLIYIPGTYSETPEVVGLARAAGKYRGVYTSHLRNETDKIFEAIEEAISIGRQTNMPVQISHFKIGKPNWYRSSEILAQVIQAREAGYDVSIDQYPYAASSTTLNAIVPPWALENGQDSIRARLHHPPTREKLKAEMIADMVRRDRPDFSYAVVASFAPNPAYNGKSITEINTLLKRESTIPDEIETILDLTEQGSAAMVYHSMNEADVENIMQYPFTMITSDGGIRKLGMGMPHPRAYGTNARVLGLYVREKKILVLEDAIRRMTSLPAQKFSLSNRGLLRPGMKADIVVFDPARVAEKSTFEKPHAYSVGMDYILVNGRLTVAAGKHTRERNGEIVFGPGTGMKNKNN